MCTGGCRPGWAGLGVAHFCRVPQEHKSQECLVGRHTPGPSGLTYPDQSPPGLAFHVSASFPVTGGSTCQRGSGTQTKSGTMLDSEHTRAYLAHALIFAQGLLQKLWGSCEGTALPHSDRPVPAWGPQLLLSA